MVSKLNLASDPFRNRNLPYIIALLMMAASVAAGVIAFAQLRQNAVQTEIAESQVEEMQEELDRLRGEGEKIQQQLSPEQRALLVASHKLVANKSFGWSRLFADLESVLPGSVSASKISVENIYKDGDRIKAELDFGVISRDHQSIMAMMDNMTNSGLFQAEIRGQNRQQNERLTYTEYSLRLIYSPPSVLAPPEPAVDVAQGGDR